MIEIDREKIRVVAEKYDLEFVVLFGSQATGQTHPRSDIDIGVISRRELDWGQLLGDFYSLFRREDVEVVNLAMAYPTLWRAVARDGKLLYEKQEDLYRHWKIYVWKIWLDTVHLRRARDKRLINWAEQRIVNVQ